VLERSVAAVATQEQKKRRWKPIRPCITFIFSNVLKILIGIKLGRYQDGLLALFYGISPPKTKTCSAGYVKDQPAVATSPVPRMFNLYRITFSILL